MLDSVNLIQFKKAFRGSLSDMLVITEACVEKNTQVLNDRHRCYCTCPQLSSSVVLTLTAITIDYLLFCYYATGR